MQQIIKIFIYFSVSYIHYPYKHHHRHLNTQTNTKQNSQKQIRSSQLKEDFVPEDPLSECDIYEFECDYSRCIPIEKKCDGYPDCDDETDEIDCPPFTGNSETPTQLTVSELKLHYSLST